MGFTGWWLFPLLIIFFVRNRIPIYFLGSWTPLPFCLGRDGSVRPSWSHPAAWISMILLHSSILNFLRLCLSIILHWVWLESFLIFIYSVDFKSFMCSPSANIFAGLRESSATFIKISASFGSTIGLNFRDRGQIGIIYMHYIFWWRIGPFCDILRPMLPKGVEIISPSPQKGARR